MSQPNKKRSVLSDINS